MNLRWEGEEGRGVNADAVCVIVYCSPSCCFFCTTPICEYKEVDSEELEPRTLENSFLASCFVISCGERRTLLQGGISVFENHCSKMLGTVMG